MNLPNNCATVDFRKIQREYMYCGTKILTLSAQYPVIRLKNNPQAQAKINSRFCIQGREFCRYAATNLYHQAVEGYHSAQANTYPFRPYDAVMKYDVTLNQNCYLSTYHDRYEFTGGAHGNTVRTSDTFSLKSGKRLPLSCFFASDCNYRNSIISQVLKQAEENILENPNIYFDDYKHLILKYFSTENYYLTPQGIAVYYQQYEIAPYSSGIVTFLIPCESLGITSFCQT